MKKLLSFRHYTEIHGKFRCLSPKKNIKLHSEYYAPYARLAFRCLRE